jgi:ABC-type glutathione transport system ATPase component
MANAEVAGTTAAGGDLSTPLLDVRDLRTSFETPSGTIYAVDRVSFDLQRGRRSPA